jgi:putative two-component system response regulator
MSLPNPTPRVNARQQLALVDASSGTPAGPQRRRNSPTHAQTARLMERELLLRTLELEQERTAAHAMSVSVVETLVNAMEARDVYLRGHSVRVAELAASIAQELELDDDTVEAVRLAGRLHDVGKIGIREAVLNKPGRLTADEFEHVKTHVHIGMEILAPLAHLGATLDFIHHHHEHVDGSGYPQGLRGDAISVGGRILAAADAYDALTSRRPYRDPLPPAETLDYLAQTVGTLLDAGVFAALCRVVRRNQSLVFLEVTPD